MATLLSSQAQEKFTSVRKKLDQLGFRQALSIDSLPLVERLLSDLMWTTENLRKSKLELEKRTEIRGKAEQCIAPYKEDNAKFVKENNQLHQRIIHMQQIHDEEIRDLRSTIRKSQSECDDLKFFNNECLQKLKSCEEEMRALTEKIILLQEKNFQAVVHTPGGGKRNIAFRRQRMDIDCIVPQNVDNNSGGDATHSNNNSSKYADNENYCCEVSQHWRWVQQFSSSSDNGTPSESSPASMLHVLSKRCEQLQQEVALREQENKLSEKKIANFRRNLELRDAEIERLNHLLEGGRSLEALTVEQQYRDNERLVAQLQLQMDLLQQQNMDLETQIEKSQQQLKEERKKGFDFDARNKFLEEEVNSMKKKTVGGLKDDLKEANEEIKRLCAERDQLKETIALCQRSASSNEIEYKSLIENIEHLTADKSKLQKRLEEASLKEKNLAIQVENMRRMNGTGGGGGMKVSGSKKKEEDQNPLDQYIQQVEQDRDYWKQEAELLRSTLSRGRGGKNVTTATKADKNAENRIKVMELELDRLQLENERLRQLTTSSSSLSPLRGRSPSRQETITANEEIRLLKQERDNLQTLLDRFERQLYDIQGNVRVLVQERDSLNRLYEESRAEVQRLLLQSASTNSIVGGSPIKHASRRSPTPPLPQSHSLQSTIKRLENEREDILTDLRRMTTERDSLRERLRVATERDIGERARLEQKVEDLSKEMKSKDKEKDDCVNKMKHYEVQYLHLEKEVNGLRNELAERKLELQLRDSQLEDYHNKLSTEQRRENELERALVQLESALNESTDRSRILEDRITVLERELKIAREESNRMKSLVNQLDEEKDALDIAIDSHTEKLHTIECHLAAKDALLSETKIALSTVEQQFSRLQEASLLKDKEIHHLRKQLDQLDATFNQERRRADLAKKDINRLQEDLSNMSRENQTLQTEMVEVNDDRDTLRIKIQEYLAEIRKLEDVVTHKEQERGNLLEQYRLLSIESERHQNEAEHNHNELTLIRLELITRDENIHSLQCQLEHYQTELQTLSSELESSRRQVDSLHCSLDEAYERLKLAESQHTQVAQDIVVLRDMCARVEGHRDLLQRQVNASHVEGDKLQNKIVELQQDGETMREQIHAEQESVRSLETILSASREKEFQAQLEVQERAAEVNMLKDRIELQESKIDQQQRELTRLRNRCGELESDIDRLNRQITSERFEKERVVQDLRRQLHSRTISPTDSAPLLDITSLPLRGDGGGGGCESPDSHHSYYLSPPPNETEDEPSIYNTHSQSDCDVDDY